MHGPIHKSREITCVMWKDKKLVFLISTYAILIEFLTIQYPLLIF